MIHNSKIFIKSIIDPDTISGTLKHKWVTKKKSLYHSAIEATYKVNLSNTMSTFALSTQMQTFLKII